MQATASPSRGPLIWVQCLIQAQKDRDTLSSERLRIGMLKRTHQRDALWEALWSGARMLDNETCRLAELARDRGVLPYAWEGTKMLEGGAA